MFFAIAFYPYLFVVCITVKKILTQRVNYVAKTND